MIISKIRSGYLQLMVSPVHYREIADISEAKERIELQAMLENSGQPIKTDLQITRKRTEQLITFGMGVADAAHVAFAEEVGAAFLSCDDKLIKKCLRCNLKVWAGNPIAFCEKEDLK